MKKIIVFLFIFIIACEYGTEEIEIDKIYDYDFPNNIEIKNIEEAIYFVNKNFRFKKDLTVWGIKEYWQTPEETLKIESGDCEDYCILFMYLLEVKLNIKTQLFLVQYSADYHRHTIIFANNKYYDIGRGSIGVIYNELSSNCQIIHIIPYPEVMWMTINYHKPVGKYKL